MDPPSSDDGSYPPHLSPRTTAELVEWCSINHTSGLTDICGICNDKYHTGEIPEVPVILPSCTHIYGSNCLIKWIDNGSNSCPACREQILDDEEEIVRPGLLLHTDNEMNTDGDIDQANDEGDPMDVNENEEESSGLSSPPSEGSVMREVNSPPPPSEEEEQAFEQLTAWRANWQMDPDNHNTTPSAGAAHAEALYSDLCEAIVCYLEDPTSPQEWVKNRLPVAVILQHITFCDFYLQYLDNDSPVGLQIDRLETLPRTARNMQLINTHMEGQNIYSQNWECANAETHDRFGAWHRRIERAQHRQLSNLTVMRNSRRARRGSAGSQSPQPRRRSIRIHNQENPA